MVAEAAKNDRGYRRPPDRLRSTLVARMSLAMTMGALLVVALLVALHVWLMRDEVKGTTGRQMSTLVARVADDIDARIGNRLRAVTAVGNELSALPATLSAKQAADFLAAHSALVSMFDYVTLVDANGLILADMPRVTGRAGRDVSSREYFKAARDHHRTVLSEPFTTLVGGYPVISVASPIYDDRGVFRGVLNASMELFGDRLFGELRNARVGESGYFTVTTRQGITLVHPREDMVMESVPSEQKNPALYRALGGKLGWAETLTEDDERSIAAYTATKNAPWIIGAVLPTTEAYAPMRQVEQLLVVAGVAAAIAVAVLAWMVTAINLAPLRRIKRQLEKLDAGHRTGHVDVYGASEIRAVGAAINDLLDTQLRMQNALRTQEQFHRNLTEHSPLGILVLNGQGHCTFANPRMEQLSGRSFTALCGNGWLDSIYEADRAAVRLNWQLAKQARRPLLEEFRYDANGRIAYVQIHAKPLAVAQQQEPGVNDSDDYVAAVVDMTAQREAWFELEREKRRADRIMATIDNALVVVNEQGLVTHLSPAAERLTGFQRHAVMGASISRVLRFYGDDDQLIDLEAELQKDRFTVDQWLCDTASSPRLPVEVSWSRMDCVAAIGESAGGVLALRNIAERRAVARQIEWEASHDALTQLPNRRAFEVALEDAHARFMRDTVNSALIMIDLDRFKQVNDIGGHKAGDEILVKVATVLAENVRSSDTAARLGGDEFALLLMGCSVERGRVIANLIREQINELRVVSGKHELCVGASQGVSAFEATDASINEIKARADAACYRAKEAGRGKVEVAPSVFESPANFISR